MWCYIMLRIVERVMVMFVSVRTAQATIEGLMQVRVGCASVS